MKNIPYYTVRPIKNLKQLVNESCELYKDRVAYYYKEDGAYQPIRYSHVKIDVDALGTALVKLGLQGRRIAVIGENRYEWAISYLSIITGTGVVIPLDKQLPNEEILNCLKRSKADAIIFSNKVKDKIEYIRGKVDTNFLINMDLIHDENGCYSLIQLIEDGKKLITKGNRDFIDAQINENEMAELLFTSGTTAESKAVMLSHKNLCFNIENQCKMLEITPRDIFLSVLPIHHAYECTCGFLTPFYRGAAVAYCEGLKHIAQNMKESHATVMLSVPLVFELIYKKIWEEIEKQGKADVVKKMIKITNVLDKLGITVKRQVFKSIHAQLGGHVKVLIAGAAAIKPEVAKGYRDFGILAVQGYGLSECGPIVALNRDVDYKDEAAGLPLVNSEIKIADANSEGIGEIIVKGDHVMMGYYENEKETKETIKDGWMYTGDLGFIDKDGFVHITGRKKNVIITKNGKNVYPEELETILLQNPLIKECLVYGKKKDEDIILSAQIVPNKDLLKEQYGDITDEEIKNKIWEEVKGINQNFVIYKHIKQIEIREKEFDKTTTMKIKRYKEEL